MVGRDRLEMAPFFGGAGHRFPAFVLRAGYVNMSAGVLAPHDSSRMPGVESEIC
jgi:hypothetical protein